MKKLSGEEPDLHNPACQSHDWSHSGRCPSGGITCRAAIHFHSARDAGSGGPKRRSHTLIRTDTATDHRRIYKNATNKQPPTAIHHENP
jgi:hypothetical protein